jgi:hypothetical protein
VPVERAGFEEGVVCVRQLKNCMAAVVYTCGLMRVWSVESEKCIAEYDLL